ncbi:MAG TPA: hypothetical protein VHB97_05285 [Polyangia bacterium]|jgi:hypothetical protein|nr:hypothetical protein [Polyangia bacterium]
MSKEPGAEFFERVDVEAVASGDRALPQPIEMLVIIGQLPVDVRAGVRAG